MANGPVDSLHSRGRIGNRALNFESLRTSVQEAMEVVLGISKVQRSYLEVLYREAVLRMEGCSMAGEGLERR